MKYFKIFYVTGTGNKVNIPIKKLEEFKRYTSTSKHIFDKIINAGKCDLLELCLSYEYPDGLTVNEVNNFLVSKHDLICEWLDIN